MYNFKRQMPQATRDKISQSMRGRKLSDTHKQNISNALKSAWSQVPTTTTDDLIGNTENNEDNTSTL